MQETKTGNAGVIIKTVWFVISATVAFQIVSICDTGSVISSSSKQVLWRPVRHFKLATPEVLSGLTTNPLFQSTGNSSL